MKFSFAAATALAAMVATAQAQDATIDDVPQFVEGPELFKHSADFTDANETRALRSEAGLTLGQSKDLTVASFQIATALGPLLPGMFAKKECHQIACWVSTTTKNCAMTAANQVQRELMRGRNSFTVEREASNGMWVRYWRTQFAPPDRSAVADGKCGAGTKFVVTVCQSTGNVYC